MIASHFLRQSLMTLLLSTFVAGAWGQAQPAKQEYEPSVGQEGKDVVWVPTSQTLVNKMLDMAKVTPQDFVIDLGSGDGRTVITAAKRGARAMGIEYNPDMVELSRRNAEAAGVAGKATFVQGDMYEADISKATVLALFLLPDNLTKLKGKFADLPPGTRIAANTFGIEGWTPEETIEITDNCQSWCSVLLYLVPAKVEGAWQTPQGTLTLKQSAQTITGTLGADPIDNGRIRGDQFTFSVRGTQHSVRIKGASMTGTLSAKRAGQ